jgi:hypothetical protein
MGPQARWKTNIAVHYAGSGGAFMILESVWHTVADKP